MEKTLLMIKPEGMKHKNEIIDMVKQVGLRIVWTNKIIATITFLRKLYKDQSGRFWEANKDYLVGKECLLIIVEGERSASRLYYLCGTHYDPNQCERGTIRRQFGEREPKVGANGQILFLNAVHRSTPENAEYETNLCYKLYVENLL